MCSIVGLQGNFKGNDIVKMLKASKNRGPDSSGVCLDKIYTDIDLDEFIDDNGYEIAFGHNLLSIYDLNERVSRTQPISNDNLTLVFNGEIYNFRTMKNFLNKVGVEEEITSDSEILLYLIDFYAKKMDLLKAVQAAIRLIDGDYAFAVYDGENLAIARDPLGVKPLFYSQNNDIKGFASTRQSLKEVGFTDIDTLKPEHILYNWEDISPSQAIYEKIFDGDVAKIDKMLRLSVIKRVEGLRELGVIFSGGLDSSYLALLLKEISENIPLKVKLYAVGAEGSKDVEAAIYASKFLNLDLEICEVTEDLIREALPDVVNAIGDDNLMKVGVGLTTYFATKMVAEDGMKVAISGQGADELFGGYKRYLKSFVNGTLNFDLRVDMSKMYHVNLERDDACSMLNGVELRLPFLDKNLVELVLNIPDNKKIVSMHDDMRKSILRKLAFEEGLDYEIAYRPKKAAQYGTGIDKILRKKIIKDTDISKYLE
ncbi:MAG: asparagine synthetase B [Methanobrevibacter sp.]|uniref:asparagine synthase-related protein n=1 Tax=Methanobrevibacter sp. TaxID=66852 RepID=UPI0025D58532|nr:asparagine synthase-related protein [Methanobrevibacter sp.]MBR3113242.1 asparagine synthetase B [Methanobrevibacter sp.]MBR6992711.1 asparagine synthetase B [Methanobrevibacter sp.]